MEGRQIERLGAAGPPESADAKNGPDQQDTDPGRSQSAENPASGFKLYGKQLVLARGGFTLPKHTKSPGAPIKIITPKGVVIFCFRVNYTKGGYFYPPLGGASRAPGLPQAAAWRICGRGPHPLCAALPACSSTRRAGRREPLSRPCGPCVPVSEWRWAGDPPRHLDGVGPRVGRGLSGPSKFRKRTPPRAPILGPLEAFDFSTRIKDRRR